MWYTVLTWSRFSANWRYFGFYKLVWDEFTACKDILKNKYTFFFLPTNLFVLGLLLGGISTYRDNELPNNESPRDRNELHSVSSAGYLITIKVEYNRKTVNPFSLHCLHKIGSRKRWQMEWDTYITEAGTNLVCLRLLKILSYCSIRIYIFFWSKVLYTWWLYHNSC